jgi:hypothetical protein
MAAFIDDIFKKLFPSKEVPVKVRENFTQTDNEKLHAKEWQESGEFRQALELINRNFQLKKAGVIEHPEVHILNSPYANGFAITFEAPFTEKTFTHLFFAFGEQILGLGYVRVSLDRKTEEIGKDVKTTDKLYFKPPLRSVDLNNKIDQLYGNVSVEKVSINNSASYLKLLATVYSDHLYREAMPFDQFLKNLFDR